MLYPWAAVIAVALSPVGLRADVAVPHFFSEHMVLQRDQPIRIWGTAQPGEEVTVEFDQQKVMTRAGENGRFSVSLPAHPAGGPFQIKITGKNQLVFKDILVGEIWFCSGQSNMEMVVIKARNHDEEVAAADYPQMRTFTAPTKQSIEPLDDVKSQWKVVSPRTVSYTSATAYFFGREIHRELKVPVGLIVSAFSGTRIEPWTNAAGVNGVEDLKDKDKPVDGELYNAMIHPFIRLSIGGVIWYQGEGNVGDGFVYYHRMKALMRGWRSAWKLGDFPFYYVQLTPLNWGGKPKDQLPEIWEAQTAALSEPNCGMIVTTDIGHVGDAHPRNKQEVGRRLALVALARTYGRKEVIYSGPIYRSMKIEGNRIVIAFDHSHGGLASRDDKPLTWFSIAGSDGKFVPAVAQIDGETVVVYAEGVAAPEAVRFGWHQIAEPNLINKHGLPASPFRTDQPKRKP